MRWKAFKGVRVPASLQRPASLSPRELREQIPEMIPLVTSRGSMTNSAAAPTFVKDILDSLRHSVFAGISPPCRGSFESSRGSTARWKGLRFPGASEGSLRSGRLQRTPTLRNYNNTRGKRLFPTNVW